MVFDNLKRNGLSAFIVLFGLSLFVASFSITSITTSTPVTVATVGTIVTITSSVTADGTGSATQVTLSGSGSTGGLLQVTDPAAGFYSNVALSTSATTLSYSVNAPTTDTYTYSVAGTYSGGSQTSALSTLQFVSPSVLEVSGTVSNASNVVGNNFTVSVTVTNPTANAISTSYALVTDASGFAVLSGDPTSGTTSINPSQSTTFKYVVNATGAISNSPVKFSIGDSASAFSSLVSNTAVATPTPTSVPASSGGGSVSTPTPNPAAATASASTSSSGGPISSSNPSDQSASSPVQQSVDLGLSSSVSGSFSGSSSSFTLTYTAPAGGFSGQLSDELPLDYADYKAGLITISPQPKSVKPGSVIATWDVALAPKEAFTATVSVAKKLDSAVLQQFKAPKLSPKSTGGSVTAPSTQSAPVASTSASPSKPAQTDNTLLYVVGALVILGLLYYFTAMRKK